MAETDFDKQIVSEIELKYSKQSVYRLGNDSRCIRNLAQYAGKPYRVWNTTTRRLDMKGGATRRREALSINLQQPMVQAYLQKINSRDPVFTCLPGSGEQADVSAASLSTAILAYDMQYLGLTGSLREELGLLMIIMADSFLKVYWDPDAGKNVGDMKEGDIRACVRSPLTMSIDPMASRLEDAAWVMEHVVRPLEWIKNTWGVDVRTDGTDQNATYQLRLKSIFSSTENLDSSVAEEYAIVKEYWEAPSRKYPEGRVITTAGGQVLQYLDRNPYGRYPYVHFGSIPMPDRIWSKSPIEMTEPIQDALNQAATQRKEYYDRARPKVMARKGMLDGKTEMNDRAFEIIEYEGGEPPSFVPAPPLSADSQMFQDRFVDIFHMVSGLNEATMGQPASGVRSAEHYAYLVEQDHAKFGPLIRRYEASWEDAARLILIIEQKFRKVERQIRITGKATSYKMQYFKGADISGNVDVRIVRDSILPTSPLLRLQMAESMYQGGKYGQPGSKEANMNFFNAIGSGSAYVSPLDADEMDKETARKENAMMERGIEPKPPSEGENDYVHLEILNLRRKEPDFKDLPNEIVLLFKSHADLHVAKMAGPAAPPIAPGADVAQNPSAGLIPSQAVPPGGLAPAPAASMPGAPSPDIMQDPNAVAALMGAMSQGAAAGQSPIPEGEM